MAEDIIKAKIVFDTSNVAGMGFGGSGGTGGDLGGGLGSAIKSRGISKGIGTIAKGVGVALVALEGIKKAMTKLVESSPRLQATLTIFNKAVLLLLRPIADTFSAIIRPLALGLLRFALPFYKKFAQPGGIGEALFTPFEERDIGQKVKALTAKIGVGTAGGVAAGTTIGSVVPGVGTIAGGAIGGIIGFVTSVMEEAVQGVKNIGEVFSGWFEFMSGKLDEFFGMFGINMDQVRENVAVFLLETLPEVFQGIGEFFTTLFTETIPNVANQFWEGIKKFFTEILPEAFKKTKDNITTFFTETLPTKIEESWEIVRVFFTDTVPNWIINAFDAVRDFFVNVIPEWFSSMISKIGDMVSNSPIGEAVGAVGRIFGVGDAIIRPNGDVIKTDPKDTIFATKNPQGFGGGTNITVNINALDANSIDSATIEKITQGVAEAMNRGISRVTTEGIGGF